MDEKVISQVKVFVSSRDIVFYIQWAILIMWIPVTLFVLFFAPVPAVHDTVHSLRHSFTFIPCH